MDSFSDLIPLSKLISLKDRTAVVTGGARGIGAAISYRLAEAGATVILADIDGAEAEKTGHALIEKGYKAMPLQCDISREEDISKMVTTATSKAGAIDILVNNAGIYPHKAITETTAEQLDNVLAVNLKGTFLCSREVCKEMISAAKGGCIVNIASVEALHPTVKDMAAYDASKGAVLTLTKSLALEFGRYDIRVNAVAPGGILTENLQTYMADEPAIEGKRQLRKFMERMPLGRMGRPDDVARVVLFLASEMSSYITGSLVIVDGGYLIS